MEQRLIDANALKDGAYINKGNFNTVEGIREWIDTAPTVEINKWLDPDIDPELALENIRRIVYEQRFDKP